MRAPRSVIVSDDFIQTVSWNPREDGIRIQNRARTAGGTWDRVEYSFDTPYEVHAVSGRQADELYVAGRTRTGEDLLEKWLLDSQTGAHFFSVSSVSTPIGTPAAAVPGTSGGIVGDGEYVPGADRPSIPRLNRFEFYRGGAFGGVVDLSSDPQGRFIIVLSAGRRALYRVPIQNGATPALLYTATDLPFLELARRIHRRQHHAQGRVYILRGDTDALGRSLTLMLFDSDNDGEFESTRTLSKSAYAAQGYDGQVWLTDFTTYSSR